jgi:hypothetical protein
LSGLQVSPFAGELSHLTFEVCNLLDGVSPSCLQIPIQILGFALFLGVLSQGRVAGLLPVRMGVEDRAGEGHEHDAQDQMQHNQQFANPRHGHTPPNV